MPFLAGGEALGLGEQGEGLLDDVVELAEAADVGLAPPGDNGRDQTPAQLPADPTTVVTLVAEKGFGPLAWPARLPSGTPLIRGQALLAESFGRISTLSISMMHAFSALTTSASSSSLRQRSCMGRVSESLTARKIA